MIKDDLLEPESLSSEQIIARVSFYYVIMITLLIFVQIVTGSNLYALFNGNELFITNIIRGITGITGILLTLVFLNYDGKTISWLGFFWESNSWKSRCKI